MGVLSGDLGNSFIFGRPVLTLMIERFPATLELATSALIIALTIGLPPVFIKVCTQVPSELG